MNNYTPGPWKIGDFGENLGYDCMTCGIRVGPVLLDGRDYGQLPNEVIDPKAKARMLSDAALISSAPDLLETLMDIRRVLGGGH
jgi:hypothetical protein